MPPEPPFPQPEPGDEGCHSPGPEALWNESWYFDAISDAGDVGVYVRLGRLPNQNTCVYTACVCGPGRPSILLVEAEAPLPPADDTAQSVHIDGLDAEHRCVEPLARFEVALRGEAQAHQDESAPLRGETGERVSLEIDLAWDTDGIPYAWRRSTRYEIPCRASGTVRVGEEEIAFAGIGQRDHSWGARDWWAVDWMWSALHLEDGTRIHAVGIPGMPQHSVGYVQRDGEMAEVESVIATEEVSPDGLIANARIVAEPVGLTLDLEPLAFGAIRLEAPDGRLSLFPRAMCRVRDGDGRQGVGWVEWNRVQGVG